MATRIKTGALTDKYYEDKVDYDRIIVNEVADSVLFVIAIIDSELYSQKMHVKTMLNFRQMSKNLPCRNLRHYGVMLTRKAVYVVDFDTDKLFKKAIALLDRKLDVLKIGFIVVTGNSMRLRYIEKPKIHCARECFKAIGDGNIVYNIVAGYKVLLEKVMR